ncbi:MAG: NAD(P)H-dependent oxidoreductase [Clostridia bacterium]|nr:NAD(P)H-dependent oxidoreductase [Clostridia bacterium]
MKIVIVHGQSHEGSTCLAARETARKIGGEVEEFFLPRDFDEPCRGCISCFNRDLTCCPHYSKLQRIEQALLAADVLIFASPVYVYHATGAMMNLLDHFGTWWMVHCPRPEMCRKQAVVIATAAGGGMKSTVRDMADSLEMWGMGRVYRIPQAVFTVSPKDIPAGKRKALHRKTDRVAAAVKCHAGESRMNHRAKKWFYIMRLMHRNGDKTTAEYAWWSKHGWFGKERPWKQ